MNRGPIRIGDKYKKNHSLQTISIVILVFTMGIILLLSVSMIYSLSINRNLTQEYIADTGELYVDKINRDMLQISSELVALLHNDENIRRLSSNVVPYRSDDYEALNNLRVQNSVLRIRYCEVQNFFVYVQSADAMITEQGTNFTESMMSDFSRELMHYLHRVTEEDSITTQWELLRFNQENYIVGWYSRGKKAIGCVIDLDTIFKQLQSDTREYQVIPYLKGDDDTYILPDYVTEEQRELLSQEFHKSERYSSSLGAIGTMYFYVHGFRGIVKTVFRMQILLIVLLIIMIVVCAAEIWIYYLRILEPIRRFSESLESIDEEQFLNEYQQNHLLELESANTKFRELIRKIQSLKIAIYEKELNEQKAELEYAQEQIRPHFYLNCLSLIHGIADRKAEKEIIYITEVLSDYIRYIFRDYKRQMEIRSELEHVAAYMEIQKLRYGEDAFVYETILDGDVENCLIPSLLLQTLVENAVVHAVSLDRSIEISLYITKEEYNGAEALYICVSDNGNGFSEEILEAIENDTPIVYNGRKHVGLQNIRRRLTLLYGEKAEIHFSNMDEHYGAVVEVHMPAVKEENR